MTENPDVTIERLEGLVDAFNRGDLDRIVEAFTEDGEFLLAAGPDAWGCRFTGRAAIREALAQRFAAVPDIRWSDGRHWISGNKALSEWRVQGTLPDGGRLDCLGCDLWEFRGGLVAKKDTYYKQVTR
jgi:ketosteroid isomerase-like protein